MKRYKPVSLGYKMHEDTLGDYVNYDDHLSEVFSKGLKIKSLDYDISLATNKLELSNKKLEKLDRLLKQKESKIIALTEKFYNLGKLIGTLPDDIRDFTVLNAYGETDNVISAEINIGVGKFTTIDLEKDKHNIN